MFTFELLLLSLILGMFLLHLASSDSTKAAKQPRWNETRILFYGDDQLYSGYSQPSGFINLFSRELIMFVNETAGIFWNNVNTVQKSTTKEGFADLRTVISELNPTILIIQFGYTEALTGNLSLDLSSYRYYLDGIISIALDEKVDVILCSTTLHGDNIYSESLVQRLLEKMIGISGNLAATYNVVFINLFLSLYEFLEKFNKNKYTEHVVTLDGMKLNFNGNAIVAARLLEVFGVTFEESNFDLLARNTPAISSTSTSSNMPFLEYFAQLDLRDTTDPKTRTLFEIEKSSIDFDSAEISRINYDDETQHLVNEDSMLA